MKEIEILGLILLMYDYDVKEHQIHIKDSEGKLHYPLSIVVEPNNYLERKGYLEKGRPTKKLYKLLDKYGCIIDQLEKYKELP